MVYKNIYVLITTHNYESYDLMILHYEDAQQNVKEFWKFCVSFYRTYIHENDCRNWIYKTPNCRVWSLARSNDLMHQMYLKMHVVFFLHWNHHYHLHLLLPCSPMQLWTQLYVLLSYKVFPCDYIASISQVKFCVCLGM